MMALETERCSPQNASSPGPNEVTQNPGTNGGSSSSGYSSPVAVEPITTPTNTSTKSKSAFHQIALLSQKYTTNIDSTTVDQVVDERPSSIEYYLAEATPTSITTSTPPSNLCSPVPTSRCTLLSNDSSSSSQELSNIKDVALPPPLPLPQPPILQPSPPDLVTPTLPPSYTCHKFTPEMYISQIQNYHAAAAAGGLPFNPFAFPTTRLPMGLKMHLYNGGITPSFNITANDYMLGLHNAKLMCEMLQLQQQQQQQLQQQQQQQQQHHYKIVLERSRNKQIDDPSHEEISHCPNTAGEGAFIPPVAGISVSSDIYSRPDSPCSSINSSRYYKQCSCSPSSTKGAPSRSPSPVALCPATSQPLAPPPRPLPFSVDNILRPEFGKSTLGVGGSITGNGSSNGGGSGGGGSFGKVKVGATLASTQKQSRTSSPTQQHQQQLLMPRTKLPKYEKVPPPPSDDSVSLASTKDSMSPRPTTDNEENGDKLTDDSSSTCEKDASGHPWPAWVYCTRYSDRPSSGPRSRRVKRTEKKAEEKRPRTAFSGDQLSRLKKEFEANNYLNEKRRQELANELGLHEAQIKIWFQNKRAKMKKQSGVKNPLALQLMAQGLYNHSTVAMSDDEMDDYSSGTSNPPTTTQTSSAITAQ